MYFPGNSAYLSTFLALISHFQIAPIFGDIPANCTYDDIVGEWTISEGGRGKCSHVDCDKFDLGDQKHQFNVKFFFPDLVVDQYGNEGVWTIIYNQGFEFRINYRKYFAFSNWTQSDHSVKSRCFETKIGWAHDVFIRDWSCFSGRRVSPSHKNVVKKEKLRHGLGSYSQVALDQTLFRNDLKLIDKVNRRQNSWRAEAYDHFEEMTLADILRMKGGVKSVVKNRPKPAPLTYEQIHATSGLPQNFDWRNVSGINYVSPVRNQGNCGSCYAFASLAMLEARYRIKTNNTMQPIFSPQDVVECSEYSQGCDGGFPYLIAGKYGQDFGIVEESCNPYKTRPDPKTQCETKKECQRFYTADYGYVGGYYGATNEALMKLDLVSNGPIAVGFEVYDDFIAYHSGVYHHTVKKSMLNSDLSSKWNPFELTSHAVLIVGYGSDQKTGHAFWTVKNSWGQHWGESGYFRIRRGVDECGIESLAVTVTPIITY